MSHKYRTATAFALRQQQVLLRVSARHGKCAAMMPPGNASERVGVAVLMCALLVLLHYCTYTVRERNFVGGRKLALLSADVNVCSVVLISALRSSRCSIG